jgi:hypothetical protein
MSCYSYYNLILILIYCLTVYKIATVILSTQRYCVGCLTFLREDETETSLSRSRQLYFPLRGLCLPIVVRLAISFSAAMRASSDMASPFHSHVNEFRELSPLDSLEAASSSAFEADVSTDFHRMQIQSQWIRLAKSDTYRVSIPRLASSRDSKSAFTLCICAGCCISLIC